MEIQVTEQVFEAAKKGWLRVITCHLDPGADKAIAEGARPDQVTLKARGTRRKGILYDVVGIPDTVGRGYQVTDSRGRILAVMNRTTSRVVIGDVIASEAKQSHTNQNEDEKPPE